MANIAVSQSNEGIGSFQLSTLLRGFVLKLSPQSQKVAAEVPDITSSSHDYIQGKKESQFLYLFLSKLFPPPTHPHKLPFIVLWPKLVLMILLQ